MAAPASEPTLSEFLQHSGRLLTQIDEHELVLHRRDGDDLVVSSKRHRDALETTLNLLLCLASSGDVRAAIPWFEFLSEADREMCIREVLEATSGGLHTGHLTVLEDVLSAWRGTALANWDDRRRELAGLSDNDEPLPLPRPK